MSVKRQRLWDFSRATYERDGVAEVVLALQDENGADVNILLFCCWVAKTGRGALSAAVLRRAETRIAEWREGVTRPLRAVRERIKSANTLACLVGAMEVRAQVLAAEIESERVAQRLLEDEAQRLACVDSSSATQARDAAASLACYLETLCGTELDAPMIARVKTLVAAAFPKLSDEDVPPSR